jgi:cation-transporting P-type ATPase E
VCVSAGRPAASATSAAARGIAVLEDGLREDAAATIAFLTREGVDVKVISGEGLATVQAIAAAVGVPRADMGIVGSDLPVDLVANLAARWSARRPG